MEKTTLEQDKLDAKFDLAFNVAMEDLGLTINDACWVYNLHYTGHYELRYNTKDVTQIITFTRSVVEKSSVLSLATRMINLYVKARVSKCKIGKDKA